MVSPSPESSAVTPRGKAHPKSLSIVIPCFNEEDVLETLRRKVKSVADAQGIEYEVILVDDGSKDRTWEILKQIQAEDSHFKVIRLSRNFGHQIALTCGLDQARGEAVLILDADLQDPPELLPEMLQKWSQGYDVVYGKRRKREGETASKKFFAFAFYRVLRRITGIEIPEDTGDFRLMDRRAVDALLQLRERHRFVRGMVSWIGYAQTPVYYDRADRFAGETKYPFNKSVLLALDAIVSFSRAPLRLASYVGVLISAMAFAYILVVIGLKFMGINFRGYTSLMGSILLLGGVQLLVLGIIGEYIGRIFEQGQNRPLYFIREVHGEPPVPTPGGP